ncbi:MAG: hypothetical protein WBD71_12450 [Xanthobacteraceae bacterium]
MSMLTLAFAVLVIAVLLGSVLFVMHLRNDPRSAARWRLAGLHGLVGIGGLVCLLFALHNPSLQPDPGTAGFGGISLVLIALAALFGGGIFVARVANSRRAGALIGVHATIAISGFVILAAYVLV